MTKNDTRDQYTGDLKRRPLRTKTQTSAGNHTKKLNEDPNSSDVETPHLKDSSHEKLYPDLRKEDEVAIEDENDECSDGAVGCATSSSTIYDCLLSFKNYILLFLFALGVYFLSPLNMKKSSSHLTLHEKLNNMQDIFQNQNRFTFRILEKALEKVVNVTDEPSAPAIFTVIVNRNAIYKSHEFSHHLANALAPQNTILINESVSWHNKPDDIKWEIDQAIQSKAKERNLFVVIVDNLHNIPLQSAMMFHSFCDHETAPFKQGVFIFIVPLNNILPIDASSKTIDKAANQQLKSIWKNASPDEIDSLITRITVNVISII